MQWASLSRRDLLTTFTEDVFGHLSAQQRFASFCSREVHIVNVSAGVTGFDAPRVNQLRPTNPLKAASLWLDGPPLGLHRFIFPPLSLLAFIGVHRPTECASTHRRFLFRFTGDDSEVSLDGDEANPPEFVEWKWVDIPQVLQGVREQGMTGQ